MQCPPRADAERSISKRQLKGMCLGTLMAAREDLDSGRLPFAMELGRMGCVVDRGTSPDWKVTLLASSREVGRCAFLSCSAKARVVKRHLNVLNLCFNFRGKQKGAFRLEHCLSILCMEAWMDAQLNGLLAASHGFPRLQASKHVKLCFEMPRRAIPRRR